MKVKTFRTIIYLLAFLNLALAQNEKKLTIKDILTNPVLSGADVRQKDFRWSPDSKFIYYFESDSLKNLALLRLNVDSLKLDTVLTSAQCLYRENDSVLNLNLASYQFFHDGTHLLLEGANDLFVYSLVEKKFQRLTTDGTPKRLVSIAPDSRSVAYIKNHNLWLTSVANRMSQQLTNDGSEFLLNGEPDWVYTEEFDLMTGYHWSPDSKRIVYLQLDENGVNRFPIEKFNGNAYPTTEWQFYPKAGDKIPEARLFVVDIETKQIVNLNRPQPRNEYIVRFDWLPDTNLVAFQTINRLQNHKKLSYGNPRSGECRLILEEKDAYWINITDCYQFLKNRNFISSSERDGSQHLYLYDFEGHLLKPLTNGNWMVTELNGVDEKNNKIYFTANKQGILYRNLFCLELETGALKVIDTTAGVHDIKMSPDCNYFLDIYSNSNQPSSVRVKNCKGEQVAVLLGRENFNPAQINLGITRFYEIPARDGTILNGAFIIPRNFDPTQKYPVLVYVYGGPHEQVVLDNFRSGWTHLLVQQGYLVFSLDNRGSYGRGRNWERQIYLQLGKYELQDQLDGIKFLKTLPFVDPNRIGIWGSSYGGYMVLMALTKAPDIFKMGISIAPVTHWKFYDAVYTERYMGLPKDHIQEYFDSAPLNFANNLKAKLLLVHGLADDNVHFQNSVEFINELIRNHKQFETMVYPNRRHGIYDPEGREHLYEMMLNFIRKNL